MWCTTSCLGRVGMRPAEALQGDVKGALSTASIATLCVLACRRTAESGAVAERMEGGMSDRTGNGASFYADNDAYEN